MPLRGGRGTHRRALPGPGRDRGPRVAVGHPGPERARRGAAAGRMAGQPVRPAGRADQPGHLAPGTGRGRGGRPAAPRRGRSGRRRGRRYRGGPAGRGPAPGQRGRVPARRLPARGRPGRGGQRRRGGHGGLARPQWVSAGWPRSARPGGTRETIDIGLTFGCIRRGGPATSRIPVEAFVETALTPLDFARRTRRLHGAREAVVDGGLRLTYEEFFDRCDRWSGALQALGVGQGDRVATIAPNTHAQLEAFYSVPQLGAVLVPMNYRLTPDDFVYMVNHSGSTVLCVHSDYLDAIDAVRDQKPGVRHYVAFEGTGDSWVDYEAAITAAGPDFTRPEIGERDLLSINYTSGTTARPKGVMITHRNAAMNTIGTLLHLPMAVGERYLWTLPMFHANGWTYTWTVTAAAGTHICLRKVDPATIFGLIRDERVSWLCAAPTVLISLANAPASVRGEVPAGVHVVTAGAPPAAATIERLEGEFGWEVTQAYGLTETAPFITV